MYPDVSKNRAVVGANIYELSIVVDNSNQVFSDQSFINYNYWLKPWQDALGLECP